MEIQVISDLHFEMFQLRDNLDKFYARMAEKVNKSELILCIAGDLGVLKKQKTWLEPLKALAIRYRAVVCIAGNHEYYNSNLLGQEKQLPEITLPQNVHYLFNDSVIIDGVRFIGGTLWTSFDGGKPYAMECAKSKMNDFRLIRTMTGSMLTPADTLCYHEKCKSYIFGQIKDAGFKKQKTVVITHHCISPNSVHPKYKGNLLNYAFFTDLSEKIIQDGPNLWLHGHTHHSFDYMLGSTRVLCNPFGYLRHDENPEFNYQLNVRLG